MKRPGSSIRGGLVVVLLALAGTTAPARAQSDGVLVVRSNDPQAGVLSDSTWLGPVSGSPFSLPSGVHRVSIVPGGNGTWGRSAITREIHLDAGDTVTVHGHFPRVYHFESDPPATVALVDGDSVRVLGQTPLLFESPNVPGGHFRFTRDGFGNAEVAPSRDFWNRAFVELSPALDGEGRHLRVDLRRARTPRRWIDYATVGISLAAGILAVHYKMKADRQFDVYRETGDPTLRPIIRRYDTYSGFAVGTMQAGLTLFTIRLIRR